MTLDQRSVCALKRVLTVASTLFLAPESSQAFELSLPVACEPGRTCIVQNYVDHDSGPGWRDFRCGMATYDTHKGTDFRVRPGSLTTEVSLVRAVAAGRVLRVRNSQVDRLVRSPSDRIAIKGRECGNGAIVDHGDGWTTQYCHLKQGSMRVVPGQNVKVGDVLGRIGQSGDTSFHHLHFSLKHNGKVVDPYLGRDISTACHQGNGVSPNPLWSADARKILNHHGVTIFNTGFAAGPVTDSDIERGAVVPPHDMSPALVFYAHIIHTAAGDRIRMNVTGPDGFTVSNTTKPIPSAKAQFISFAGKRRKTSKWPLGVYRGEILVLRGDKIAVRKRDTFNLGK